jgi:hypothetical protein
MSDKSPATRWAERNTPQTYSELEADCRWAMEQVKWYAKMDNLEWGRLEHESEEYERAQAWLDAHKEGH